MRRHHTSARRKGSLGKFLFLVLLVLAVVGGTQYFRGGVALSGSSGSSFATRDH